VGVFVRTWEHGIQGVAKTREEQGEQADCAEASRCAAGLIEPLQVSAAQSRVTQSSEG
jgi:hypothetical protein